RDKLVTGVQTCALPISNAMWLRALLAWAYARKGNHAQAIAEYEKMGPQGYAVLAENQLIASGLGWINAVAGRRKDAERVIEHFKIGRASCRERGESKVG